MPRHNLGTIIPFTNGDNPGTDTGVASGTVIDRSKHITGVSSVVIRGQIATRLMSQTLPNKTNAQGARKLLGLYEQSMNLGWLETHGGFR